jgi:signal transduction histidine kinase
MPLDGDALRLSQVIAQVLDNAAKFTDHGGRIEVRVERDGATGVVRVRDTGVGIAPDSLPAIFTPFVRGSRSSSHAPSGLGLGLALARRLAELHGGSLDASSPGEGHGSEFVLRLPLA